MEELHRTIVHAHRHRDDELALRFTQHGPQLLVQVQSVSSDVELALGHGPRI